MSSPYEPFLLKMIAKVDCSIRHGVFAVQFESADTQRLRVAGRAQSSGWACQEEGCMALDRVQLE